MSDVRKKAKKYILKNKGEFSREEINKELEETGVEKKVINDLWKEIQTPEFKIFTFKKAILLLFILAIGGLYYLYISNTFEDEFYVYNNLTKKYKLSENVPLNVKGYTLLEKNPQQNYISENDGVVKANLEYSYLGNTHQIILETIKEQKIFERFKKESEDKKFYFVTYENNKDYLLNTQDKELIWKYKNDYLITMSFENEKDFISKKYFNDLFEELEDIFPNDNLLSSNLDFENYDETYLRKIPNIENYSIENVNFFYEDEKFGFKNIIYQKDNLKQKVRVEVINESQVREIESDLKNPEYENNYFFYKYNGQNLGILIQQNKTEIFWISSVIKISFEIENSEELRNFYYNNDVLNKYLQEFPLRLSFSEKISKLERYKNFLETEEKSNFISSIKIERVRSTGEIDIRNDWGENVLIDWINISQENIPLQWCKLKNYTLTSNKVSSIETNCNKDMETGSWTNVDLIFEKTTISKRLVVR